MAASMSKTRADAYAQFRKWLGEQPYWLQDAAYRIYRGQKIEDKQIQTYVEMCVAEISKEQYDFNHIDDTEIEAGKTATRMAVLSLSDIVGVNALAQDARLDFSPEGVTVIYGLNGAGKSGFMRIFKQLSGNPYEEPIQPNVFRKAEAVQPSCSFRVCVNDEEQSTTCVLTRKANRTVLEGCDVFDTRISNAYINIILKEDDKKDLNDCVADIKDIVAENVKIDDDDVNVGYNEIITDQMKAYTVSINGNVQREFIKNYIDNMRASDAYKYRQYVNNNKPGLDYKITINVPESDGGGSFDTFLDIDDTIFINI